MMGSKSQLPLYFYGGNKIQEENMSTFSYTLNKVKKKIPKVYQINCIKRKCVDDYKQINGKIRDVAESLKTKALQI